MTDFSPREIVSELDRFIVGQADAKRAVAIALRNRWRRLQLDDKLREEVLPKNILMIGPTGVGKTEISRRLAKLAGAPFIKVEATKFTEVGYVGRDVEQIVRDLSRSASRSPASASARTCRRAPSRRRGARARRAGRRDASPATKRGVPPQAAHRRARRQGDRDRGAVDTGGGMPMFEIPGMPGAQIGAINLGDIFGKAMGGRTKTRRVTVKESLRASDQRGVRQAARPGPGGAEAIRRSRTTASCSSTRSTRSPRARPRRRRRVARGRAARPAAADRGHHRLDQARLGEDRPHPVHRLGRVPRRPSRPTCCPNCRAGCRSASS
jgi:hypothetical protein